MLQVFTSFFSVFNVVRGDNSQAFAAVPGESEITRWGWGGEKGIEWGREMAAGDLTVILYSGTGSHKGDEQSCGRDEKVTRNPATEKLQPRWKVTVGNWDGDNGQIAPIGPLTPLGHLNPLECPFHRHFQHDSISLKEEGKSLTFNPAVSAHCLFLPGQRHICLPLQFFFFF